jgi:hypothetical protein
MTDVAVSRAPSSLTFLNLFAFSSAEDDPRKLGYKRARVYAVAEKINLSDIKDACDYLNLGKNLFPVSSGRGMKFEDGCESIEINGTNFSNISAEVDMVSVYLQFEFYCVIKDRNAITITTIAYDRKTRKLVRNILSSIKIDR